MTTLLQELVQQDAVLQGLHKRGRVWFASGYSTYQPIAVSADKKAAATAVLNKAKKDDPDAARR